MELSEYLYTIRYRPGRLNSNADALSRMVDTSDLENNFIHFCHFTSTDLQPMQFDRFQEIAQEQRKDPHLALYLDYLTEHKLPDDRKLSKLIIDNSHSYEINNDRLC